jgi:hypothetical protein
MSAAKTSAARQAAYRARKAAACVTEVRGIFAPPKDHQQIKAHCKPKGDNMTEWHSGPPPSLGWWPASIYGEVGHYRWWDGACWSFDIHRNGTAKEAGRVASLKSNLSERVGWQHRPDDWPERSRT